MSAESFRDLILNTTKPIVIHKKLKWLLFDSNFEKFAELFDQETFNKKLNFEKGNVKYSDQPQFERLRSKREVTLTEFVSCSEEDFKDNWYCYNYKYVNELPEKCKAGLNFAELGFSDFEDDVSFWIGSKNSHTPCHQDSYGINIVVQVFGRKSWLLFPPNAKLKTTRVPYEESSVYTEENFYSPKSFKTFLGVENVAHHVVLNPGDILVVPQKWFHFVKVLEKSLNFNWWIKLEDDMESQIDECLTKILIKNLLDKSDEATVNFCLNPNEVDAFYSDDLTTLYGTLQYLVDLKSKNKKLKICKTHKSGYLSEEDLEASISSIKNFITPVNRLENFEFFHLMKENMRNFEEQNLDSGIQNSRMKKLINVSTNCDIIRIIKENIIKDFDA